jgi:hypothetical protein
VIALSDNERKATLQQEQTKPEREKRLNQNKREKEREKIALNFIFNILNSTME